MKINIKRSTEAKDLPLPEYKRNGDVAFDIVASETVLIEKGQRVGVGTGLHMEIPDGYAGLVWDRSGLAFKNGLTVLGGVIDSNYRGEIKVCILNTSDQDYEVEKGERIAQMVIQPVVQADLVEVEELNDSERGEAGFGSSGRK